MKFKIGMVVLTLLIVATSYAQYVFNVGSYIVAGPTVTMPGRGSYAVVYQIKLGNGIDSLFCKLEGTIDSTTYGFTNLAQAQNDSIAFARGRRDSTFLIRYDGQMPLTRFRICRIVKDTVFATIDSNITVRGYYENR